MNENGFTFSEPDHRYELDGQWVPSVTQILRAVAVEKRDGSFSRWFDYSMLSATKSDDAMARGRWTMDLCETRLRRLDQGNLPPAMLAQLEAEAPDWFAFYRPFEAWLQRELAMGFSPMLIETPMVSRRHRFAGRPDIVCVRLGNRPTILEIKTGIAPMETAYQTAAQALLVEEQEDYQYREALHDRFALELRDDGSEARLIPHREHAHDRALFLAALTLFQHHNGNGR